VCVEYYTSNICPNWFEVHVSFQNGQAGYIAHLQFAALPRYDMMLMRTSEGEPTMEIQVLPKEQIIHALDTLPPESLREMQRFLDFLRFKSQQQARKPAIALGGLLEGYRFTEESIAQARREMWGRVDRTTS